MRTSYAYRGGLTLVRTPNARRQAQVRRLAVAGVFVVAVAGSALIGAVVPPSPHPAAATGPFSYFPTQ